MPMVTSMKVNGLTTKLMLWVLILIWMELCIKENGGKINNMVKEWNNGQIKLNMKDSMNLAKNMEREHFIGLIIQYTKEIS